MSDLATSKAPRWWPTAGDEPDPRWTLANERTLLAYGRTALSFVVAGLAVIGSRRVADTSVLFAALGYPLLIAGAVVVWTGRRQYLASQVAMRTGEPLEAPLVATILPLTLGATVVAGVVAGTVELFVS